MKDILQDTGYRLGYLGYGSGYKIYIRIEDINQDTGYTSVYRVYIRIQGKHQ